MVKGEYTPTEQAKTHVARWRGWLLDLVCMSLLGLFWVVYVTPLVVQQKRHGGDVFRDAASAVNMASGQLLADPAYRGETIWYPPLSPAMVACLSVWFDVAPLDCYRWSQLLFNWLIPAGLYLLVRLQWGWRAAAAATTALLLAMPWWQSEVAQGQPSTHAVVWGWAALFLYGQQQRRGSRGWAVACGVFQGIAFWHHPLIPAVLTAAFALQAIWAKGRAARAPDSGQYRGPAAGGNLLVVALTAVLASPVIYLMLHGPVANTVPREFIAPELLTVEFALLGGNPWLWGMGLVGLVAAIRRADFGSRLLVCAVGVCVVGQLVCYPRILGWAWAANLPVVVPHEFQWSFQLGWAVCVGLGMDRTLRALADRSPFLRGHQAAAGLVTLAALALTGGRGLGHAEQNLGRFLHTYANNFPGASAWIRQNTDLGDVFACEPIWAFAWLNPTTGRKVWLTEPGHSNPRVDWERRYGVLAELEAAPTPQSFLSLARRHGIDYCIPSDGWMPRIFADPELRLQAVPAFLQVAYQGGSDEPTILRVREAQRRAE